MKTFDLKINGTAYVVDIDSVEPGMAKVRVNGKELDVQIGNQEGEALVSTPVTRVSSSAPKGDAAARQAETPIPQSAGGGVITSPLPGVIIAVSVSVGEHVEKGQCLAVLEAMKMENSIEAEHAGTVKKIYVNKGDSILEGAKIIAID